MQFRAIYLVLCRFYIYNCTIVLNTNHWLLYLITQRGNVNV